MFFLAPHLAKHIHTHKFSLVYVFPFGAQGETRTHTPSRAAGFESAVAAITPLEHLVLPF